MLFAPYEIYNFKILLWSEKLGDTIGKWLYSIVLNRHCIKK